MTRYKRTALKRWRQEQAEREQRREQARQLAYKAAELLRKEFNVTRVLLFGSLIHPDRFTRWSDVDLAAWGLTSSNWLRAMATVRDLSDEIDLNLVDVSCCLPTLLEVIEREGVPL
jgi:predicted nucleotidyltransferase